MCVDPILWNCVGSRSYDLNQQKSGVAGECVGAWASSLPTPYKYLDVPHTTRELRSGPISWCVRRPNICTGPASSGRVVWALMFWQDYLRFTDPTIVFPDPSVDTRVPRTAQGTMCECKCEKVSRDTVQTPVVSEHLLVHKLWNACESQNKPVLPLNDSHTYRTASAWR